MQFKFESTYQVINALRVAAQVYKNDAKTCSDNIQLAIQFEKQANLFAEIAEIMENSIEVSFHN